MIIPPVKLVAGGRIVDDVFRLILAQIRSKHETAGDFRAQIAANATGVRRMQALVDAARPRRRSSRRWTSCSTTPSGARAPSSRSSRTATYEAEGIVDNDGYTDEPVRLAGAGSRSRPDGVHFDTTGSDPQRRAPVNSTYAMTLLGLRLRAQVPDRPRPAGQRRLLPPDQPSTRPRAPSRTARWPAAGRRRLGDADRGSSR